MAACIAEGRLAPANARNPGRQDRRAAPVCSFVVQKKRGRNIAGRKKGFQNGGPVSGTSVLHTQSASLCVQRVAAVAETPEPFVRFPGNGLDKASSIYLLGWNWWKPPARPGVKGYNALFLRHGYTARSRVLKSYAKFLCFFPLLDDSRESTVYQSHQPTESGFQHDSVRCHLYEISLSHKKWYPSDQSF